MRAVCFTFQQKPSFVLRMQLYERTLTFASDSSTLKMSAAEEFPTVTTSQPHLAKQDLSQLVSFCFNNLFHIPPIDQAKKSQFYYLSE